MVFLGGFFKKLLPYFKSPLWNLRNFKVSSPEQKKLYMVPKLPFWVNLRENLKKLLSYLRPTLLDLSNVKFHAKQKTFTFRPEFEKTIVLFEISLFEFDKMRSFMLIKKINFGTKIALFGSLNWNLRKLL